MICRKGEKNIESKKYKKKRKRKKTTSKMTGETKKQTIILCATDPQYF